MVDFTLEFRSGDRYDHGYDVPDEVIQQGEQAVKEISCPRLSMTFYS